MRLELNKQVVIKPAEEIMVGYLAASVVENDCWKEEVTFIINETDKIRSVTGSDKNLPIAVDFYKDLKRDSEKQFKEKNDLKQMPGKYRSAKSVICKALAHNIELLDADGFPRGKTEVERDLNVIKKQFPIEKLSTAVDLEDADDPYIKAFWCAQEIKKQWSHLSGSQQALIVGELKGYI